MSNDPESGGRSPARLILFASLLVAVLLRAEYLRELILSPFGRHLLLDAEWYDQAARGILAGHPLSDGAAYFRPPLYPYFVAGIYALADGSPWAVRGVQWILGVVHVWLCWGVAMRTHGERVAALTAVLAATYGMFIYFEGEILTTTLGVVLSTTAVLLLLEGDRRSSALWFLGGGIALGLAAVTHGTALLLAPAAALWALTTDRRWLAAVAVTVGVLLPVGGVTARNWAESGEAVLVASQGGINFYVGNNPQSDGKSALAPGMAEAGQVIRDGEYEDSVQVAARTLAERDLGRSLTAAEINRYWFGQGLEWMRSEPKAALAHLAHKVLFFWNGHEISNNRDLRDQAARFTPILRLFLSQWAILLPFGILGVFEFRRNRGRGLLLSFLAVYTVAIAAFFVCSRYRQPAVAWLLPFGAAGMLRAWDHARGFQQYPRRATATAILLIALFLVTNGRLITRLGLADVTSENDAPFHRFNLAIVFEREGDLDLAIAEYRAAAESGAQDPRIHLNLGNALARTGRAEEARDAYRVALRIGPDFGPAVRCNLGILAAQGGEWPEAIRQFQECVRLDPAHLNGLLGLGSAYLSTGRFDEAIVTFRQALNHPGAPERLVRRNLAVAYLEAGLPEDAEKQAQIAIHLDATDVAAVLTLGKVYVRTGRSDDAERMWRRALEIGPDSPTLRQAIAEARKSGS